MITRINRCIPLALTAFILSCVGADGVMGPRKAPSDARWNRDPMPDTTKPWVRSNKDDYIPGEMVIMFGGRFQAGEQIRLTLEESPNVHEDREFTTTADSEGNYWFDGFRPEEHDIGVSFSLTALGLSSGYQAQTTFTDAIIPGLHTTNNNGDPGASELTLQKPASVVPGTFMLAQVTVEGLGETQVICPPSGWTPVLRTNQSSAVAQQIFWKVAGVTEPTGYTWQLRTSTANCGTTSGQVTGKGAVGGIIPYTGVDAAHASGPILASSGATASANTVSAPSINAMPAGARVVRYFGNDKEFAITTAAGPTLRYSVNRPKPGGGFQKPSGAAADANQAPAGATGTVTGSNSGNGGNWVAQTIVLREAPVDGTAPTVTINQAAGQADPTGASPINFTVVFSEAVTGFTASDVSFTGSTVGGTLAATVTGAGPTYNVAVTGMSGSGTVVASVPASVADDLAGNDNTASTSTDNSVTYDGTAPTVTINQAAAQSDPTNTSPINFTVVFSETVTGFATGDVTLGGTAGATTATVTGSGTTYNVAVSGMTTAGTVVASIAADAATDGSGNGSAASTSTDNTVTYDAAAPTVTIDQAAGQSDPTSTSPINFTVTFSEAVTGFGDGDVSFTGSTVGGTLAATVTGTGPTYNVAVTGMSGSGTVVASIAAGAATDGSGNGSAASTSTDNSVTYDGAAPTVTINQAAGQADPTGTSPINFTVVFSEAVTGFATGDVTLSGTAGAITATVTGSGTTYNVAVSGMTGDGTVIASIAADKATDAAGNGNAASTSTDNSVTYDGTAPTVTINQAAGQADPTGTSPINFTVTFSESVAGFTGSDVSFSSSTVGGTLAATVTGTGPTYNVAVTGMSGSGTVVASIAAGAATDGSGNGSAASTSTDNTVTYDGAAPTVTINQAAGQADPTGTSPINFTVVFSETVFGFTTGDVTLSGTAGATTATVTGSGPTYNVAVSGMTTAGTVVASIAAGAAADGSGNGSATSTSTDNSVTWDPSGPVTSNVVANPNPVKMNTAFELSAKIDDSNTGNSNIKSAEYSVDGGAWISTGATATPSFNTSPTVTVKWTVPGMPTDVYRVCVRGTDAANNEGVATCILLAVYDPTAGFVTGGGWITSPPGAFVANPDLTGRANFGFVSKYKKGATVPDGSTEFQFQAAGLNFHSTIYDWLVVSGFRAQFKGAGRLNGLDGYGFLLTAIDGTPDKFRIKITNPAGVVVYDNGIGAPDEGNTATTLGGGNIVIHKP